MTLRCFLPISKLCRNPTVLPAHRQKFSSDSAKSLLFLLNSRSRKKEPLQLSTPPFLTWYCCGPTVYDSSHLGHAYSYMQFDMIRRVLEHFRQIPVVYLMNITDIDDKIIARANQTGTDWRILARTYEREFLDDMRSLNIRPPTFTARISDFIPETIEFVQTLLEKNVAYAAASGSVYFDTRTYGNLGKLRVDPPEPRTDAPMDEFVGEKRYATDFALWKGAKAGEPSWEVPFSEKPGRPGWHVECSTIASHYFGSHMDLHSGGIDLLFPHHHNEESQSCAYHGVESWVRYWIHAGHLQAPDEMKMAKSLKNFVSIRDFLEKHTAEEFRMFCMMQHYRKTCIFSDVKLDLAAGLLARFTTFLNSVDAYLQGSLSVGTVDEVELHRQIHATYNLVHTSLADDFNIPAAIEALSEMITACNRLLLVPAAPHQGFGRSSSSIAAVGTLVDSFFTNLGLFLPTKKNLEAGLSVSADKRNDQATVSEIMDCVVDFRSKIRETGRQAKTSAVSGAVLFELCDNFRDELLRRRIRIKDHGKDSSWEPIVESIKSTNEVADDIRAKKTAS